MSNSRPVKVAMIGLGWWGRKMTAVLQKAEGDIEIVCAAEPNPAGREFAEANGFKHYASDTEALQHPGSEAIIPATPHLLHAEQIKRAVAASLAMPFVSRFAVYGSRGWIDIRDKAHVEAPAGWVVTAAMAGGPITVTDVPPAEPVKENLVAFARAVRGGATYPITREDLVNNISILEATVASAATGGAVVEL